jgi:hypothetical protein
MATTQEERPSYRPRFDWRAEALLLALVTAEAAVIWLVVDLVLVAAAGETFRMPATAVFLLIFLGSGLPRWLEALGVWERTFAVMMAVAIAATTLYAIRTASFPGIAWTDPRWLTETAHALVIRPNAARSPVWGMIALSAYAWWRGKIRAEPGPDAALTMLRVGTPMTLIAVAAQSSVRSGDASQGTSAAVLVFFVAALAGIAITRLRGDGGRGAALGPRWLSSLLTPVLAVVVVAVAVAALLSREALETMLWLLAPLIWGLSVVFRIVILALALVAFVLVSPIIWFLSRHPIDFAGVRINTEGLSPAEAVHRMAERSSQVPDAIRYLIAAAVLLLLFTGVTRLALRRRRRAAAGASEERTTVLTAREVLQILKSLLSAGVPRKRRSPADPLAALRGDPRWQYTVAIRETYGRFLRWSQDRGLPRGEETTPLEHEQTVATRVTGDGARADLAMLTGRYNLARYGAEPATANQAAATRDAWRRLRSSGRARRR